MKQAPEGALRFGGSAAALPVQMHENAPATEAIATGVVGTGITIEPAGRENARPLKGV